MSWIMIIISLYLVYYTLVFAKMVWQEGNYFASIFIMFVLGGSLISLPIWLNIR
jgi:hypothetical protein